jgi:hypothetical protein
MSDGRHYSTTRLQAGVNGRFFLIGEGAFLVSEARRSPQSAGHPFHVINSSGIVERSFGTEHVTAPHNMVARLFHAQGNQIWAVEMNNLRLERYENGQVANVIGIDTDAATGLKLFMTANEFKQHLERNRPRDITPHLLAKPEYLKYPPQSAVSGIAEVEGVVFVSAHVPDSAWQSTRISYRSDTEEASRMPDVNLALYDTMLFAVDPQNRRLLAVTRLDGPGYFSNDGLLVFPRVEPDGLIRASIFEVRMSTGSR